VACAALAVLAAPPKERRVVFNAPVSTLTAMPGERVTLQALDQTWTWTAPLTPGLYPISVVSNDSRDSIRIQAFVLVPFVLPTVVVATAFIALLPDGVERSVWAILLAHVFFNVAVVVRVVQQMEEEQHRRDDRGDAAHHHPLDHGALPAIREAQHVDEDDRRALARVVAALEHGHRAQRRIGDAEPGEDRGTQRRLGMLERQADLGEANHAFAAAR